MCGGTEHTSEWEWELTRADAGGREGGRRERGRGGRGGRKQNTLVHGDASCVKSRHNVEKVEPEKSILRESGRVMSPSHFSVESWASPTAPFEYYE